MQQIYLILSIEEEFRRYKNVYGRFTSLNKFTEKTYYILLTEYKNKKCLEKIYLIVYNLTKPI